MFVFFFISSFQQEFRKGSPGQRGGGWDGIRASGNTPKTKGWTRVFIQHLIFRFFVYWSPSAQTADLKSIRLKGGTGCLYGIKNRGSHTGFFFRSMRAVHGDRGGIAFDFEWGGRRGSRWSLVFNNRFLVYLVRAM